MSASQLGNQMLQAATRGSISKTLMQRALLNRWLNCPLVGDFPLSCIMTQPFLPFSAQRLWIALGKQEKYQWQIGIQQLTGP